MGLEPTTFCMARGRTASRAFPLVTGSADSGRFGHENLTRAQTRDRVAGPSGLLRCGLLCARNARRNPFSPRWRAPVWMSMRMRIGPNARVSCASCAASTAPGAVGKATKKASPCVFTSIPPGRARALRISAVRAQEEGIASGANNAIRELEGVIGGRGVRLGVRATKAGPRERPGVRRRDESGA